MRGGIIRSFPLRQVTTKRNACDINVTPDKRTVLLHAEEAVKALLKVITAALQLRYTCITPALDLHITGERTRRL
jgi:DNA mismatch repair ATPase MutL